MIGRLTEYNPVSGRVEWTKFAEELGPDVVGQKARELIFDAENQAEADKKQPAQT